MSRPEPGDTLVGAALKVLQVGKHSQLLLRLLQDQTQQWLISAPYFID
jgi:hypothetical protein